MTKTNEHIRPALDSVQKHMLAREGKEAKTTITNFWRLYEEAEKDLEIDNMDFIIIAAMDPNYKNLKKILNGQIDVFDMIGANQPIRSAVSLMMPFMGTSHEEVILNMVRQYMMEHIETFHPCLE